jgi:hypothetical protein
MNTDRRPQIHRRRHAINRLRSMTTGVAIAGIAGTAGFGALAAATWSGDSTSSGASGASDTSGTSGSDNLAGDSHGTTAPTARTKAAPKAAPTQQPTVATPRVQRGSGSGHASTGGSH